MAALRVYIINNYTCAKGHCIIIKKKKRKELSDSSFFHIEMFRIDYFIIAVGLLIDPLLVSLIWGFALQ